MRLLQPAYCCCTGAVSRLGGLPVRKPDPGRQHAQTRTVPDYFQTVRRRHRYLDEFISSRFSMGSGLAKREIGMFNAVITDRGRVWLEEGDDSPTRRALATLVSPHLEAADPRALFDVFCVRLSERVVAPQSTDECRILWRKLCGDGAITLRQGFESYCDPLGRIEGVAIGK
jgi:hypothetical protein